MLVVHKDTGAILCSSNLPKAQKLLADGHVLVKTRPTEGRPDDHRWTGTSWIKAPEAERREKIKARQKAYPPVGDQLDVIWKQFNKLRLDGAELIQEADDMLGKVLAVKRDHPL